MPSADPDRFDYVLVGAGSAGCVLAARLTEDAGVRVLLLEAGPGDDIDEVRIPAAFFRLFKTSRDWDYTTEEQRQLDGRRLYWPRGRMLGGCSSMNAMIYVRGSRTDYDGWRDGYGAAGWGYADLLPYFRRAEDAADPVRAASPYHGTGGPLRVENLRHRHELSTTFLAAAAGAGLPGNYDMNGAEQDGVGFYQVSQRRGRRWSTVDGYLRPTLARPGLTVRTDALAVRVEIAGGRATGVRYRHRGVERVATVESEVVLCGGAVNSPHLLLLSGVGPAGHLREHGVRVLLDAPAVGAGLQDHLAVPVGHLTRGTDDLYAGLGPVGLARWYATRRGPLASNVAEAGGFLRTRAGLPAADVQFHVAPVLFLQHGLVPPPGPGFTLGVTGVAPASRGRVRLRSADPRWKPAVQPEYLTAGEDLDSLIAGVRLARHVADRPELRRFLREEYLPGVAARTDAELRDAVRASAETLYHPVGTCAMSAAPGSVVDTDLRVRGVAGLRVVDASVMPAVPRGNTNAPTVAVAERAADLLRGRLPLPPEDPAAVLAGVAAQAGVAGSGVAGSGVAAGGVR